MTTYTAADNGAMRGAVARIALETPVTDIHTHLFAPIFGDLLLYGVDEMLTYHYLIAEVMRVARVSHQEFWALDKRAQADLIWRELFLERAPLSEATRGVLTALKLLGLDVTSRDLESYRAYFTDVDLHAHIDKVFAAANLKSVVMTNDPFDLQEQRVWRNRESKPDPRFKAALRIDPLLLDWRTTCSKLKDWGYDTDALLSKKSLTEVRRFLDDWLYETKSLYMAVSLPPEFTYPDENTSIKILEKCVLPVAKERGVPFAMMIGVTRGINRNLKLAGDGLGKADVKAVERLCARFPENKFMVTMLSRENQHELCVVSRKFGNLLPFGCWWFLNNPSLIEEMTRMRLELLGLSFIPQHSDARVLEQVVYKWDHSRKVIAKVLADKYEDLLATGWTVTEDEMRRDMERLLGGNLYSFLER